jgi:hypothetical protein
MQGGGADRPRAVRRGDVPFRGVVGPDTRALCRLAELTEDEQDSASADRRRIEQWAIDTYRTVWAEIAEG